MDEKKFDSFLAQALNLIKYFLPLGSTAIFPLLYSTIIWAIKKKENLEAEISGLELSLDPDIIYNKPAKFILKFFEEPPELKEAFKMELEAGDLKSLRQAFRALYPVVGLKEPFLQGLFSEELDRGDYRLIAAQYDSRLKQALSEIEAAENKPGFWATIKKIGKDFLSLGWALINEPELRAWLKAALEKNEKKGGRNENTEL
ncbi:MAG: hypothetical protein PHU81_08050 [Acidobacteriota bacterium]|nr:hypothetical protein [Acidobacteriota bacterium]